MSGTAVIYHSYHGNARAVAEALAADTGADLYELSLPGLGGLTGFRMYFRLGYLATFRRKPRIEGGDVDISEYENLIFGTPVWSGTFSPALRTFLSGRVPIRAKRVGAFICHKGGPRRTATDLARAVGAGGELFVVDGIDPAANGTAVEMARGLIAKMGL